MKKKGIIALCVSAVLVATLFIPAVQSFAVSALSVFRVGDAKTIQISVADIESIATQMSSGENIDSGLLEALGGIKENAAAENQDPPESRKIDSVWEFSGFPVNLPTALDGEQPTLRAVDAYTRQFVLDTAVLNEKLAEAGLELVNEEHDGAVVTLNTPPALVAEYQDVVLVATQGMYVDAPGDVVSVLWRNVLKNPVLTENLRSQLEKIDPQGREVYLPVLQGVGRETAIGANTGYLYATRDLAQFVQALPEGIASISPSDLELAGQDIASEDASVLIWTKDGVLYCVFGQNKTDGELVQIAGSIKS